MEMLLLGLRAALAAVLLVAAVGKVRDQRGSATAAAALGVPERLSRPVAALLPVIEVVAAGLLLGAGTARSGAAMALALLAAFTVAVARTLSSGRRPPCHCFGQTSDEPIGARTLIRNGVLLALAAVVLLGGPSAEQSLGGVVADRDTTAAVSLLGVVVLLLVVSGFVLAGDQRALRRRLDDLEAASPPTVGIAVGRPAPAFDLPDLDGRRWTLDELAAEKPVLLVFTDAACGPCAALMPELADWSLIYEESFRIVVIAGGGGEANRSKREEHGLHVLLDDRLEVARRFRYDGTPGAVAVGTTGLVLDTLASGADGIRRLVARLGARGGQVSLPVGVRAPRFHIHALDGEHIDNDTIQGQMSVLLFWDDGCSFCQRLEPEVLSRLGRLESTSLQLLVISSNGTTAFHGAPRVQVADDRDREVAETFGAAGTPSALLLDADGRVSRSLAVGADEVLALFDRALHVGSMSNLVVTEPRR